jgi:hypothetical protein
VGELSAVAQANAAAVGRGARFRRRARALGFGRLLFKQHPLALALRSSLPCSLRRHLSALALLIQLGVSAQALARFVVKAPLLTLVIYAFSPIIFSRLCRRLSSVPSVCRSAVCWKVRLGRIRACPHDG